MRSRHFCYYHLRARPVYRPREASNGITNGSRTRRQLDAAVNRVMTRVMNQEISTQQAAAMICALEAAYESNT